MTYKIVRIYCNSDKQENYKEPLVGYTHYFTRTQQHLDPAHFTPFVLDCQKLYARSEIPLAGWDGTGEPAFQADVVSFNGVQDCGHTERDLGIVWPSQDKQRGGVAQTAPGVSSWGGGARVSARTCDGDCSHETFRVERDWEPEKWQTNWQKQGIFSFCKTAYKPYDILVTACLIALKQHFPDVFTITSDGESHDWEDGRRLCQHVLGYGKDFRLEAGD